MALYLRTGIEGALLARERNAITCVVEAFGPALHAQRWVEAGANALVLAPSTEGAQQLVSSHHEEGWLAAEEAARRMAGRRRRRSRRNRRRSPALAGARVVWPGGASAIAACACGSDVELYLAAAPQIRTIASLLTERAEQTDRDVVIVAAAPVHGGGSPPEDLWVAAVLASLLEGEFAEQRDRERYEQAIAQVLKHGLCRLFERPEVRRRLQAQSPPTETAAAARAAARPVVLRREASEPSPELGLDMPPRRRRRRRRGRRSRSPAAAGALPAEEQLQPAAAQPQHVEADTPGAAESTPPPHPAPEPAVHVFTPVDVSALLLRMRL